MIPNDNEVDMTRSNNGMQTKSPEQTQAANAAAAASASASVKPKSNKHQSTAEEVKAWVESKGLQPPR